MKRQSAKKCASAYKIKVLKISAVCALLVMLAVFITTPPDALARSIWRQTHIAPLATLLVPNDASLRFEIGNYYFGGGADDGGRSGLQGIFEVEAGELGWAQRPRVGLFYGRGLQKFCRDSARGAQVCSK